jgi:hypothetical protein
VNVGVHRKPVASQGCIAAERLYGLTSPDLSSRKHEAEVRFWRDLRIQPKPAFWRIAIVHCVARSEASTQSRNSNDIISASSGCRALAKRLRAADVADCGWSNDRSTRNYRSSVGERLLGSLPSARRV